MNNKHLILSLLLSLSIFLLACTPKKAFTTLQTTYYFRVLSQYATANFVLDKIPHTSIDKITLPTWKNCNTSVFKRGAFNDCTTKSLETYINQHIEIPNQALQNKTEGNIVLHFTLQQDGSIAKLSLQEDAGDGLGTALQTSIQNIQNLSPAHINRETPVSTEITLKVFCDIVLR